MISEDGKKLHLAPLSLTDAKRIISVLDLPEDSHDRLIATSEIYYEEEYRICYNCYRKFNDLDLVITALQRSHPKQFLKKAIMGEFGVIDSKTNMHSSNSSVICADC